MIERFCDWLTGTPLSHFFSDRIWTIAISQTIHIVCVAIVMVAVGILNLRILGVAGRRQSVAAMSSHFMPWIWTALSILLVTGIIQTIAEPGRELLNVAFRIKMALLLIVVAISYHYQTSLRGDAHYWDRNGGHRGQAVTLASLSLFLWVGIVVCGRLIAYMDMRQNQ